MLLIFHQIVELHAIFLSIITLGGNFIAAAGHYACIFTSHYWSSHFQCAFDLLYDLSYNISSGSMLCYICVICLFCICILATKHYIGNYLHVYNVLLFAVLLCHFKWWSRVSRYWQTDDCWASGWGSWSTFSSLLLMSSRELCCIHSAKVV